MTSVTCSGVEIAGRPERYLSVRAASLAALKRFSQVRTVIAVNWSCCALAGTRVPWWARRMMRARSTNRTEPRREWTNFSIASCSAVRSALSLIAVGIPPDEMPHIV